MTAFLPIGLVGRFAFGYLGASWSGVEGRISLRYKNGFLFHMG